MKYKFIKANLEINADNVVTPDQYSVIMEAIGKATFHPRFSKYAHITETSQDELIFSEITRKVYSANTFEAQKPGLELKKTNQSTDLNDYSFTNLLKDSNKRGDSLWLGILYGSINNHECPTTVPCPKCDGSGNCTNCGGTGKVDCDNCDGSGRCPHCDGWGEVDCQRCDGTGIITCPDCGGQKVIECPSCNGEGVTVNSEGETETCHVCGGKGCIPCTHCMCKGTITCPDCEGKGKIKCEYCDGTGKCPECNGDGEVECDVCSGTGFCQRCGGSGLTVCPDCNGTGHYQTYKGYQIDLDSKEDHFCSIPEFADTVTKNNMEPLGKISVKNEKNTDKELKGNLQVAKNKMEAEDFNKLKNWLSSYPTELKGQQINIEEEVSIYKTALLEIKYTVGKKSYKYYVIASDKSIAIDTNDMPSRFNLFRRK